MHQSLYEQYQTQIEIFVGVCHQLAAGKYVTGYGGNMAWKMADDLLLITPTQMNKGDITARDLVFIGMDGSVVEGERRPTGETPMYVNFFRERPDIQSVIHCHPPYYQRFCHHQGQELAHAPALPRDHHRSGAGSGCALWRAADPASGRQFPALSAKV